MKSKKKLDSYLHSLENKEKQVTLRSFFIKKSQKNEGDFNENVNVQSKLSFFDSTSTKMHSPELDNRFMTPLNCQKKLEYYSEKGYSTEKKAETPMIESQGQVAQIIPSNI
jgi:hypothetical protein